MARRLCIAIVSAIAVVFPAVARADWPVYGHDLANSRNAGLQGPPASQAASLPTAWTFKSSTGDFTGTPVIADGVLVAGNNGGWVYALDAVTGAVLWSRNVGQPIDGSAAIDTAAPGGATAFVPVAQSGSPRLLAFSLATGAERWDTVLTNQANASVFGSPTYWRGTVYIGTSGPNNDNSHARGSVVALDEATGAVRWQTFTVPPGHDGAAVWSTPAIDTSTGRLYVGTGNNYHQPTTGTSDSILALDAAGGQILGDFQATAGDNFTATDNPLGGPDFDFGASPNLLSGPGGRALVGEGQKSGTYWMLDRASLSPLWHTSIGPGGPLGGILGSTAFDGARVFAGDTIDGSVAALTRAGVIGWTSHDAPGHLGAVTVAHGVLYTSDPSGSLTARDPATGGVLGKRSLGAATFGGISADGRALYVAVGTGPPPAPAPQQDGSGSIVAFGDTSHSGGSHRSSATGGSFLPAASGCASTRKLRFRLRRHSGIVKLEVFVNGHRRLVLRHRGRGHGQLLLRLAGGRRARVKLIAFRSDGTQLITTRMYSGCGAGRAHSRVRRRHR